MRATAGTWRAVEQLVQPLDELHQQRDVVDVERCRQEVDDVLEVLTGAVERSLRVLPHRREARLEPGHRLLREVASRRTQQHGAVVRVAQRRGGVGEARPRRLGQQANRVGGGRGPAVRAQGAGPPAVGTEPATSGHHGDTGAAGGLDHVPGVRQRGRDRARQPDDVRADVVHVLREVLRRQRRAEVVDVPPVDPQGLGQHPGRQRVPLALDAAHHRGAHPRRCGRQWRRPALRRPPR